MPTNITNVQTTTATYEGCENVLAKVHEMFSYKTRRSHRDTGAQYTSRSKYLDTKAMRLSQQKSSQMLHHPQNTHQRSHVLL